MCPLLLGHQGWTSEFTCTSSFTIDGRGDSPAVKSWKKDHTDATWRAFTASEYHYAGSGKDIAPSCEVDEWPPDYFLTKEQLKGGTNDTKGRLVRWVPRSPNKDAGRQWREFCKQNDGDEGNGLRKTNPTKAQQKANDPL